MPNGKDLTNELDFEQKIREMDDRGLLEFMARQVYESCNNIKQHGEIIGNHDIRIVSLESGSKKTSAISGGITATIVSIVIGVIEYFRTKS